MLVTRRRTRRTRRTAATTRTTSTTLVGSILRICWWEKLRRIFELDEHGMNKNVSYIYRLDSGLLVETRTLLLLSL